MQLNFHSDTVSLKYYPAALRISPKSGWRIEFYAYNPYSNNLERVIYKVNKIRKKFSSDRLAKQELLSHCQIINMKLMSGWSPFVCLSENKPITIIDALDNFILAKKKELREDSIRTYISQAQILKAWLYNKRKENYLPSDFTRNDALDYMDYVYLKRNVSNKTYNNYRIVVSTFFNYFLERNYCAKNHFATIKPKRTEKKKRTIIPLEVRQKISDYLKKENYPFYLFLLLEYSCLMRPIELFKVQIKNFNLNEQFILLEADQTKNRNTRCITIPNNIIHELRGYFETLNTNSQDYLFSENYLPGTTLMNSRDSGRTWQNLRKDLDLPAEYQLYSFRDTSIVDMLMANISPKVVQTHADHSDLSITSRYARHVTPEMNRIIKEEFPRFI